MTKTYVFDTNVLLSLKSFTKYFPNIHIPFIVLEELDKLKTSKGERGACARKAVRLLRDNQDKVEFQPYHPINKDDIPDDLILELCNSLKKKRKDVCLITNDILLSLKAKSKKIETQEEDGFEFDGVYSGWKQIDVESVDDFYSEQFFVNDDELFPNQFVVLKDLQQRSAIGRFISKDKPLKKVEETYPGKIQPRSKEQKFLMNLLFDDSVKLVSTTGTPGSGKTLCCLSAGLEQVLNKKYKSLIICRPMESVGKEIGFLPGSISEKCAPWMEPIKDNLRVILSPDGKKSKSLEDTLNYLFDDGTIEIQPLSFIRGRSINNSFVIFDEAQNCDLHEVKTVLTRIGENAKIVLTGDLKQIDVLGMEERDSGLFAAIDKFRPYNLSGHITLSKSERSPLAELASLVL